LRSVTSLQHSAKREGCNQTKPVWQQHVGLMTTSVNVKDQVLTRWLLTVWAVLIRFVSHDPSPVTTQCQPYITTTRHLQQHSVSLTPQRPVTCNNTASASHHNDPSPATTQCQPYITTTLLSSVTEAQ